MTVVRCSSDTVLSEVLHLDDDESMPYVDRGLQKLVVPLVKL